MTSSKTPSTALKPDIKFLRSNPAHVIALGFGSGLCPIAPGTAGTVFAWVTFYLINFILPVSNTWVVLVWPFIIALSFLLGLWACKVTADNMLSSDPGSIVWDEVVAFWLVLYTCTLLFPHLTLGLQAAAFTLFRLFDMIKKGPVYWADQKFKGTGYRNAFGIMFDDIVAAVLAILSMYGLHLLLSFISHA